MGADERSENEDAHEAYAEREVRLAFGRKVDGRVLHVSEVVSGLACECICPACSMPLVAKRGELKQDHFAHHVVGACRYAPETAAHAFGKQLLDERRRIVIPEIRGMIEWRSKLWRKEQSYEFDGAVLEHRLGDIIPDVILRKGDRELLVEIAVTHRCDARKRQRIRELGISAIEIDLSGFRWASREKIVDAILKTAPREWLFNPHIDRIEDELRRTEEEAVERQRQAEDRRVERLRQSVAEARSRPSAGLVPPDLLNRVRARGLGAALYIELAGDFCFAVPRGHWQAVLLERCVLPLDRSFKSRFDEPGGFTTKKAFGNVKFLLHPGLGDFVDGKAETRLRKGDPDFVRPFVVVVSYLEALRTIGLLTETWSGWTIGSRLQRAWEERRQREEETTRRSDRVIEAARLIVAKLPEAERRSFDLMAWFRRIQPAFECSFASCIEAEDPRFDAMATALGAVEALVVRGGPIVDELLELPLEAHVRRIAHAREVGREEKAREAAQAALLGAEERVRQITLASIGSFGSAAWAETPNAALGGATPQDYARENSERLNKAIGAVTAERHMREARLEAEQRKAALAERNRSQLVDVVQARMTTERADLFLRSAHPKLGRCRPIDYCVDDRTRETCLALLDSISSSR